MDRTTRSAARAAALVAVPAALLTGIGAYLLLSGAQESGAPGTEPTVPPPPPPVATAPVETEQRELTEWEETVCRALLSQLPGELDGLAQRPVTAGAEQNAAYGEPAVVVECGVPQPEFAETDTVYPLPDGDGVCWHAAEGPDGSTWTTLDREVPVLVTVPDVYDGPGQLVTALSGTVVETVRSGGSPPPGCD